MLALPVQGPEFAPQNPHKKKTGMMVYSENPRVEWAWTGGSLWLTGRPIYATW